MLFKLWRKQKMLSLDQVGKDLGLPGVNVARTVQRIESGEALADADLINAIGVLTDGAVRADDMHASRLEWLRRKGRDRFVASIEVLHDA
jgi:hypothetical protein